MSRMNETSPDATLPPLEPIVAEQPDETTEEFLERLGRENPDVGRLLHGEGTPEQLEVADDVREALAAMESMQRISYTFFREQGILCSEFMIVGMEFVRGDLPRWMITLQNPENPEDTVVLEKSDLMNRTLVTAAEGAAS
jgi:hypothetical protein